MIIMKHYYLVPGTRVPCVVTNFFSTAHILVAVLHIYIAFLLASSVTIPVRISPGTKVDVAVQSLYFLFLCGLKCFSN